MDNCTLPLSERCAIFSFVADRCNTSRRKNAFALVGGTLRCAREEWNLPQIRSEPDADKDYRAIQNDSEDARGADVGQDSLP